MLGINFSRNAEPRLRRCRRNDTELAMKPSLLTKKTEYIGLERTERTRQLKIVIRIFFLNNLSY